MNDWREKRRQYDRDKQRYRHERNTRIPTRQDFLSYQGGGWAHIWREIRNTDWRCPSCDRSPHEIMRWTIISQPFRVNGEVMGWAAPLHKHHCHTGGPQWKGRRFDETLVCGDCNSADGAAKRKLKLPENWSFSPQEIARFTTVTPFSGEVAIDFDRALRIYRIAQKRT